MFISITNSVSIRSTARGIIPLCVAAVAYLFFLTAGEGLLRDSDSFWQIKVGQWIIDHAAMPYTDIYSFTRFGESWISSSWLAQVLYATVYGTSDWSGPVILTSLAIAATAAIFIYLLQRYFDPARSTLIAAMALLLSTHHFLARPHVLALPVMLAFVGGLMAAADRRSYPSLLLLPLMTLWANLHGGFVLGLALIGPIGLEAVWCTPSRQRFSLAVRWAMFGLAAIAASCCTPYGWYSLMGAAKILDLGKLLSLIAEWMPADFSSIGFFEATLLGLIGLAFYSGLVLSVPRVILLLGLIWMALTHVRNIEVFAFVAPLVLAKPIVEQLGAGDTVDRPSEETPLSSCITILGALAIGAAGWTTTTTYVAHHHFSFIETQTPAAAVDILEQRKAQRIFNTAPFGGYLISRGIKVFIDGRAELYGEKFVLDYFDAVEARKVESLLHLLEEYRIDTTLLNATSPAAQVMDHIAGWKRLYADDVAVIHVRDNQRNADASAVSQTPD